MKSIKYISLAAVALMGTLSSCQHDEEEGYGISTSDVVGVRIAVGQSVATRSNPLGNPAEQRLFTPGDIVSISTNDQEEVWYKLQDDSETWKESETNKFLLWTADQLTFSAYYPTTAGTSMTSFSLPDDQSSDSRIADADYMTKSLVIARPSGGTDIDIELERQTARVIIKITGFNNQYADADKLVSNVRIHSAASKIADGAASGDAIAVTPAASGDGKQGSTYTALVIPTEANESASFVTMTDGENKERIVRGIPAMEPGKSYTYNLVVGKDKIEIASVTVKDWTTGVTLSGGRAEEIVEEEPFGEWLPGIFSVSGDKKVNFSRGNLQASTTDLGATWTWAFAANQWDVIGTGSANNKIISDGTVSENGTVDLFGWVGKSNTTWTTGGALYGISATGDGSTYGSVYPETLKKDWGTAYGDGTTGFTLSKAEWQYLISSRGDHSYAKATVNSTHGVILLPDNWNVATYSLSYNNGSAGFDSNEITAQDWKDKLEPAGAVFLPAGGSRWKGEVGNDFSATGNYWTTTSGSPYDNPQIKAYLLCFNANTVNINADFYKLTGMSVRLVRIAQ